MYFLRLGISSLYILYIIGWCCRGRRHSHRSMENDLTVSRVQAMNTCVYAEHKIGITASSVRSIGILSYAKKKIHFCCEKWLVASRFASVENVSIYSRWVFFFHYFYFVSFISFHFLCMEQFSRHTNTHTHVN